MITEKPEFTKLFELCKRRGWELELFATDEKLVRLTMTFDGKILMTQRVRKGDIERAAYSLWRLLTLRPDVDAPS